jgi:hypothetical protein
MDDIPLCPPWWPKIIWDLHFWPFPTPDPPPNPVNYPPAMDDIFSKLAMHTFTYKFLDRELATELRGRLEESLATTVRGLSDLHETGIKS